MTVFTTNSWMNDQGCNRHELERALGSGSLLRLRRGVVMPAEDLPPWDLHRCRVEAAALKIQRGTYFALESAALVHGLPVRITADLPVRVFRTMGGHHTRNRLMQAWPAALDDADVEVVDGLPVTGLTRTVLDLVRRLAFPDAVAVVDAALRRGLDRESLATPGTGRGHVRAARAVAFGDPASESPGESHSRARMHLANIPRPRLQFEHHTADGRYLGRSDFDWEWAKVVGEFDGESKYGGTYGVDPKAAILAEKQREQAFVDEGYLVVRWSWRDLQVPGRVEGRIRRALAVRRVSPP
jgi:hypothetical protein